MEEILIDTAKYVITLFIGFAIAWFQAKREEKKKEKEELLQLLLVIRGALQSFLRDALLHKYIFYVEGQGWCPYKEKKSIQEMFDWYEKLGENGIIEGEIEKIKALPETKEGANKLKGGVD